MKVRRLGSTGMKVSQVCLGTMTFGHQCDEETSFAIMDKAAEFGVNFIDTADAYPVPPSPDTAGNTEEIVGSWLQGQRDSFILATKCRLKVGYGINDEGLSRRHIMKAVEDSLRRLKTDYIDLYQAHMPDTDTPLEETLRAYDDLVRSGKVRYVGVSNFPAWMVALGVGICRQANLAPLVSVQPRYNLLYREIETELFPFCQDQGLGVIAYNPLAGGLLTGKYRGNKEPVEGTRFSRGGATGKLYRDRYWHNAQFDAVTALLQYFEGRNKSLTQVAIAWVLAQPAVTCAIVGASKPEQLDQSLPAVNLTLEEEERNACNEVWYNIPRQEGITR